MELAKSLLVVLSDAFKMSGTSEMPGHTKRQVQRILNSLNLKLLQFTKKKKQKTKKTKTEPKNAAKYA